MLRDWILGLQYIQYTGYLLAFFGALLETLPAVGLFVPGQTVVVIAGFLAQQGVLNIWLVLVLAILGAMIGDLCGYLLGRKYGTTLFRAQRGIISDITKLLREHAFKTLIVGRFHSLTRAFTPFAAGASGIRFPRFLSANIVGSVAWGTMSVAIGYVFGASYELAAQSMDRLLVTTGLVVSAMLLVYYYLKKHNVVNRSTRHLLFINIGSLILFVAIVRGITREGLGAALDKIVHDVMPLLRTEALSALMLALTPFYHLLIISILTAGSVFVLWKYNKRNTVLFAIAVIGAVALERTIKVLTTRLRPEDALFAVDTYAFPSGHAVISTVFFGGLVLVMTPYVKRKVLFIAGCVAAAALVSFSRVYLGVHWLSDVIGGVLLGLFWLTFVFLIDEAVKSYSADRKKILKKVIKRS